MKHIFWILLVLLGFNGIAQYNPSVAGVPTNQPLAIAQAVSTDARSRYFDAINFVQRDYVSTSEVISYLNLSKYRQGGFDIYINFGGTLGGNGVITGGVRKVYYFKNGTADGDLVQKSEVISVNGQVGVVISKSADSLKGQPIDTSVRRNGYAVTYDSVARKYYLAPVGTGGVYTGSSTIDVTGTVISALNTTALWNASQIRGRSVTTNTPAVGRILKWDGTNINWLPDNVALDTAYYSNDTLYLIGAGDTSKVVIVVQAPGDNWGTQTVVADVMFMGVGVGTDPLKADTITWFATQYDLSQLRAAFDSISVVPGSKTAIISNSSIGDSVLVKQNDSTYIQKKWVNGTNTTVVKTDSTLSINASPGSAEVNTISATITADTSITVPVESMIDCFLVKPTANLTAFKIGTVSNDDEYVDPTPVQANGEFQKLISPVYLSGSTAIYFANVGTSTAVKIIYKPLHN